MYSYEQAEQLSSEYYNGNKLCVSTFLNKYALRDNEENLMEATPDQMHRRLAKEFARIEKKKFKNPLPEDFIYALFERFNCLIPQGSPMYGIGNPYKFITLSNCYVLESPHDSYSGIMKVDEDLVNISKRRGGVGICLDTLRPSGSATHNSSRRSTGIPAFAERYSNSIREVGQDGRRGALMLCLNIHHPDSVKLLEGEPQPIVINEGMEAQGIAPIHTTTDVFNPHDIDFCSMKLDRTKCTGANISLFLTNEFLEAVRNDTDYEQRWPLIGKPKIRKMVNARKVWKKIIKCAWLSAEPGLLFLNNFLMGPADCYTLYKVLATNPCAEIGMCANDSCRLLLLNLLKFVKKPFTPQASFDYYEFYKMAGIAQRLMDDLVDLEAECIERIIQKIQEDPEPEDVKQRELALWNKILYFNNNGRRTGTGVTAVADVLAMIGVKYGSDESIKAVDKIYKTLKFGCYRSSVDMAKELGPFADYDASAEKDCDFLNRIKDEVLELYDYTPEAMHPGCVILGSDIYADMKKYGRRNIACTTTPPAGTTSLHASFTLDTDLELPAALLTIFGTSSGIEPVYMMAHWRNKKVNPHDEGVRVDFVDAKGDSWQKFKVYHEPIKLWMLATGETDENKSPWAGACANDISWTQRVKLQAAAQKHVCHSISSTINLPNNVTEDEVAEIYLRAWEDDVKGITIYRDGCRTGILTAIKSEALAKHDAPKRPQSLDCDIHYTRVGNNSYAVIVGTLESDPYEIFVVNSNKLINEKDKPKSGKIKRHKRGVYELLGEDGATLDENIAETVSDNEEAIARLISSNLRHGCDIKFLTHQLEKTHGDLFSFSKAIARVLKKYIKDGESVTGEECKECGGKLIRQSGCIQCSNCGWSKC